MSRKLCCRVSVFFEWLKVENEKENPDRKAIRENCTSLEYFIADHHVNRYIQRGFTSLMFCFGCTGGQHRSVYSAQHLAEHIHEKFGVEVQICHREQQIEQVLPAK